MKQIGSSGSGFRFRRLFWGKKLLCVSVQVEGEARNRVPVSVPGKTAPTVPVSGSGYHAHTLKYRRKILFGPRKAKLDTVS